MIEIRTFDSLGGANHGWLDAKHHFSFANYHDRRAFTSPKASAPAVLSRWQVASRRMTTPCKFEPPPACWARH